MRKILLSVTFLLLAGLAGMAQAQTTGYDRHQGYYYPAPQTVETYVARVKELPEAERRRRIAFVIGVTGQAMRSPFPPQYAIFAKGDQAEKLIIVGLDDGRFNTIYRMRALLAMLTSMARTTPVFRDTAVSDELTFLDMLKMMGFKRLTVTDGATISHQINIK